MRHWVYAGVLLGCLLGTAPLELILRVRVYARWRRLVLALLPGLILGWAWDFYAVHHGQWSFDFRYLLGARVYGLPIEELAFFVVIPICAVLTYEAVVAQRPAWADA
jgi:lycopene cyclase domain-containing protein